MYHDANAALNYVLSTNTLKSFSYHLFAAKTNK